MAFEHPGTIRRTPLGQQRIHQQRVIGLRGPIFGNRHRPCDRRCRRDGLEGCLPVVERHRRHEDDPGHASGAYFGDPGHDDAPHAVPDQHHVVQILELQHRGDVGHHGVEADLSTVEVVAFPETGERRSPYQVAAVPSTNVSAPPPWSRLTGPPIRVMPPEVLEPRTSRAGP